MSSVIPIDGKESPMVLKLNSNDSDRGSLCKDNSAPIRQQSALLPFGKWHSVISVLSVA